MRHVGKKKIRRSRSVTFWTNPLGDRPIRGSSPQRSHTCSSDRHRTQRCTDAVIHLSFQWDIWKSLLWLRVEMQTCASLVLFVLSSLRFTLSKAQKMNGSGLSCLRLSPADDGRTRITFLVDVAGARSLHVSHWSEYQRLETCERMTDPMLTERYVSSCNRSDTQEQEIIQRFNISSLLAPDAPCALVSSSAPRSGNAAGKIRGKRSWIFPGTLWCGAGSRAARYDQLGEYCESSNLIMRVFHPSCVRGDTDVVLYGWTLLSLQWDKWKHAQLLEEVPSGRMSKNRSQGILGALYIYLTAVPRQTGKKMKHRSSLCLVQRCQHENYFKRALNYKMCWV